LIIPGPIRTRRQTGTRTPGRAPRGPERGGPDPGDRPERGVGAAGRGRPGV